MGKPTGFLEYNRQLPEYKVATDRTKDYKEIYKPFSTLNVEKQAARCMDCGIPFCHNGCPLGNNIPDFNDMVYKENWKAAYDILISTNNFPEFTGRICPAPCEASCVLNINKESTAIELIEKNIIERAYAEGWVKAVAPISRTDKKVAIIGSGPSGLATAAQLNSAGHDVTVFERDDRIGGLLRYGIPDFKLEKTVINRRLALMEEAGIKFQVNANVGENIAVADIEKDYDAIILTGGSTVPRGLPIEGSDLKGVNFAMDFLKQSNKRVAGDTFKKSEEILSTDKHVVVIGGGDTGSDCVGTSNRHGAKSITQLELLPKPPEEKNPATPWPGWPVIVRTSSSHLEGCDRHWSVLTKNFVGDSKGNVKGLNIVDIEWAGREFKEIKGTEREIPCDVAYLAIGFMHPQHKGMIEQLGIDLDERGNVKTKNYQTSKEGVFAAGDMRRGQSLVVHAINEGREAAQAVDVFLTGSSVLETKTHSLIKIV